MNCEHFIKFSETFKVFNYARIHYPQSVKSLQQSGDDFYENTKRVIENSKIFEINDGLKKLLCLTDPPNKNDEVHLPFSYIFLDVDFTKEELQNVGIDIDALHIVGIGITEGRLVTKFEEGTEVVGKDLNITISSLQNNGEYWFDTFNKNMTIKADFEGFTWTHQENPTTDKKAREFVHKFIINFINFLNNPDVEIVEHKRSEGNVRRRIKQGKTVIPSSMRINIYGRLREYIDRTVSGEHFHYGYSFWVRGHFRELKSNRYKEKKRIWILPYIKGDGILIEKTYFVKEKK